MTLFFSIQMELEAKDTEGIEFETEGLKKSLQEIIKIENMENLIDHIMKKLAEHCEGEQQFDDITLVACKLRAESTTTYNKLQVIM